MIVIESGRKYLLHNTDSNSVEGQEITFAYKEEGMTINGTKNEELLKVLLHRMNHLNKAQYCKENIEVISHLNKAFDSLKKRKERKLTHLETTNN